MACEKPWKPVTWRGRELVNQSMAHALLEGHALDVLLEGEELVAGGQCADAVGFFRLRRFVEGVDYCDPSREAWVWSIGRALQPGVIKPMGFITYAAGDILASLSSNLYQHPKFECLFLR